MQNSNPKNTDEYISPFPKKVGDILKRLRKTIKRAAPTGVETMSYGMPAFKLKGKPLVYFAGYKNHIGFYALPSGNEAFQKELLNYKTGKGSIQFPISEEIPWKLIRDIVKFRTKEIEENSENKRTFRKINFKIMLQNSEAFSGYSVKDIEKAKKFYENLLGLKVKDNPMGHLELHFQNGHSVILYPKNDHETATFTVLNFPVKNIENTVDKLIEKGIAFLQYEEPIKTDDKGICWSDKGPDIAWFKDPAGNILSVLEE
ncbi:DUF1801 domain-containing protein [Aequorivita todarodis]|uniref:DUF1801 domain-containing protein n=1 Tax=Aequorivita todarodis TaxID=2036821 RepID=UPI0023509564|nr:DUF1801 domain-containing protein [Aequorivita todarodis]MDC8001450.1 DUF1801 domain-containing protein [Aequorivita todarodis]